MKSGVKILQPIIRNVCSMSRVIRDGAELCGFVQDQERYVTLDIRAILMRCKAFAGCSPREMSAYVAMVERLAAKGILENWNDTLPKFIKIMPVDYRRALKVLKAQKTAA